MGDDTNLDDLLDGDEEQPPRRRRWPLALGSLGALVLLAVVAVGGLLYGLQRTYDANIRRVPHAFAPVPSASPRPAKHRGTGENWLLVGTDRRADVTTTGQDAGGSLWKPGAQRSDTLMLVHLTANHDHAYVVSFPRDSWVTVPGHGKAKINAAFSYGGPPLTVATVEQLTGVHVDHIAIIDFKGFETMTRALGGVDVRVAQTVHDAANDVTWHAGVNHLDGPKALLFVRQRYGLPHGDFDRIKRQQAFLSALMDKLLSAGTLTHPLRLHHFMEAATRSVSVDDAVTAGTLRSLAFSMRGLRQGDVSFMTVPVTGTGREGKQSVVYIDRDAAKRLYAALRRDRVGAYTDQHEGAANHVGTVR